MPVLSKRAAVLEAARALVNVPIVSLKYEGVPHFVVPAGEFYALGVALKAFEEFRAAELKAGGINPDGSTSAEPASGA